MSRRKPPGLFPPDGGSLECSVYSGRTPHRRHTPAHAGDRADHYNGNGRLSGTLLSLPWGGAFPGLPPERSAALAERALTLARAHQERGHQAYALRLLGDIAARREPPESESAETHYRQALALAEELGMRPLQ